MICNLEDRTTLAVMEAGFSMMLFYIDFVPAFLEETTHLTTFYDSLHSIDQILYEQVKVP